MTETPTLQRPEYSHLERLENLASLYLVLDMPERALAALDKCLRWNPEDAHALAGKNEALRLIAAHQSHA